MIEALVLDFDGVIVNSMPPQCKAWEAALATASGKVSDTQKSVLIENFWNGAAGDLIFKDTNIDEDIKRHLRQTKDNIWDAEKPNLEPFPGAVAAITRLHSHLPLAIATTARRDYVEDFLERFELNSLFKLIIARQDVTELKPASEALDLIVNSLSIPPQELLLVGDTAADSGMAQAAGSRFALFAGDDRHSSSIEAPTYKNWPALQQAILELANAL